MDNSDPIKDEDSNNATADSNNKHRPSGGATTTKQNGVTPVTTGQLIFGGKNSNTPPTSNKSSSSTIAANTTTKLANTKTKSSSGANTTTEPVNKKTKSSSGANTKTKSATAANSNESPNASHSNSTANSSTSHQSCITPVTTGALVFGGDKKWLSYIKSKSYDLLHSENPAKPVDEIEINCFLESKLNKWLTKFENKNDAHCVCPDHDYEGGGEEEQKEKKMLEKIDEEDVSEAELDLMYEAALRQQNVTDQHVMIDQQPDMREVLNYSDDCKYLAGSSALLQRKMADLHLERNDWNLTAMQNLCNQNRAMRTRSRMCHLCSGSNTDSDYELSDYENPGKQLQAIKHHQEPKKQAIKKCVVKYRELTCKSQNTVEGIIRKKDKFRYPMVTHLVPETNNNNNKHVATKKALCNQEGNGENLNDQKQMIANDVEVEKRCSYTLNGAQTFNTKLNALSVSALYYCQDDSSGDSKTKWSRMVENGLDKPDGVAKFAWNRRSKYSQDGLTSIGSDDNDFKARLLEVVSTFEGHESGDHDRDVENALLDRIGSDFNGGDKIVQAYHTATCSSVSFGFSSSKGCYKRRSHWRQEQDTSVCQASPKRGGGCCFTPGEAERRRGCYASGEAERSGGCCFALGDAECTGRRQSDPDDSKTLDKDSSDKKPDNGDVDAEKKGEQVTPNGELSSDTKMIVFEKSGNGQQQKLLEQQRVYPKRRKKKFGLSFQLSYYVPNRFCSGKSNCLSPEGGDDANQYCQCHVKKQDEEKEFQPGDAYLDIVDTNKKVSDWLEPESSHRIQTSSSKDTLPDPSYTNTTAELQSDKDDGASTLASEWQPTSSEASQDTQSQKTQKAASSEDDQPSAQTQGKATQGKYVLVRSESNPDVLYIRRSAGCNPDTCQKVCPETCQEACVKIYTNGFEEHGNFVPFSNCQPMFEEAYESVFDWVNPCRFFTQS